MADRRSADKSAIDAAKSWLEQRKHKTGGSTSFAPHTPPAQRSISTFSSPGSVLGKEEDAVIIELAPRYLLAGLEGDSGPQCRIGFGPEGTRRIGDYQNWIPGYRRKREPLSSWGRDYELWRNDLRDVDLGLLSDTLERTVREAYNKHLLLDAGSGRLVMVLPSLVPHPVLETILSTLFRRWRYSAISLLSTPAMTLIAAGLRSGLVVEIGWEETVITSVYEYREVAVHRSTRATKALTKNVAKVLKNKIDSRSGQNTHRFDLDFIEEIIFRAEATIEDEAATNQPHATEIAGLTTVYEEPTPNAESEAKINIDWPNGASSDVIEISKAELVKILHDTYLNDPGEARPDDHEISLPNLIYRMLFSLSPDVRGICMSRITFSGNPPLSKLIRHRIISGVQRLITEHGWSMVRGKNLKTHRPGLSEIAQVRTSPADAKHDVQLPNDKDYVEAKLQKQKARNVQPRPQGICEVRSLGPWTGASLLSTLKVRGLVEVDRDRFLSHGLSGASREVDAGGTAQQRMSTFGIPTSNRPADRTSWTLGGWR